MTAVPDPTAVDVPTPGVGRRSRAAPQQKDGDLKSIRIAVAPADV